MLILSDLAMLLIIIILFCKHLEYGTEDNPLEETIKSMVDSGT